MKTRKQLFVTVLCLITILLCVVLTTGCDKLDPNIVFGGCTHEWSEWTVTKEASCTEQGTLERKCSLCETIESSVLSITDHDWVDTVCTKLPTCSEPGEYALSCSNCAESSTRTIPPTGSHNYYGGVCVWCEFEFDGDALPSNLSYTVSFNADGGQLDNESMSVDFNEEYTLPTPIREGYSFNGWYYGDDKFVDGVWNTSSDITLTAKWSVVTYNVRFVDENGEVISTATVAHGDKVTEPEDPEKYGCFFVGWFHNGLVWSFDTDSVTKDITLTVKWIAYVVYSMDGGANHNSNPTEIYSDDEFPIALLDPIKENYVFKGWYSDSTFTTQVDSITICTSHVLYALWEKETPDIPTSSYPWDTTELRFQLSDNSNYGELPSSSRRYLAGNLEAVTNKSTIDDYVYKRNSEAYAYTNVNVTYTYLDDSSEYAWGENIDNIYCEVMSYDPSRADMYCNFVYDMVTTSLKGSFANLLSKTMNKYDPALDGMNYFEFASDPTFYESYDEDGYATNYMFEYMRGLTLSKWKMYCLASDYFIDAIRASMVIPVNVGLLETLQTGDEEYIMDRVTTIDSNGRIEANYTIEDFYALVEAGLWNYETLAKFSAKIEQNEDSNSGIDIHDTIGFALGTSSGLSAIGMLYSTPITIIDRTYSVEKQDYTYSYPYTTPLTDASGKVTGFAVNGPNEELCLFSMKLQNLLQSDGVVTVRADEGAEYAQGNDPLDIGGIRNRFATGHILFGGVVTLGSLEYNEYTDMSVFGYGIAPVPLYSTTDAQGKPTEYKTHIHNIGQVGAISYSTDKFAQCTAFLDYQSTHSTEVLYEYYTSKLAGGEGSGGIAENVDMLKFIRSNARSSLDKVYEDAMGVFYRHVAPNYMEYLWHKEIWYTSNFTATNQEYANAVALKALCLYNLENNVLEDLPQ